MFKLCNKIGKVDEKSEIHSLTIKCNHCGNMVSRLANRCPKCKTITQTARLDKCRSCGNALIVSEIISVSQIPDSTKWRGVSEVATYNKCPHCGDPRPFAGL